MSAYRFSIGILLLGQLCLLVLERAVALIQGYVFAVLRTLNHKK
jgi:F0F1-type ATP synthase membrane subunit a